MQNCSYCKSHSLVWDWANGDIVCTKCGTINQEKFIDDRSYYKDHEDHEHNEPKVIDKKINNLVSSVNSVLYNGMVDDTSVMSERVEDKCCQIHNNKLTSADIVAGVYACEKGLTAKELCVTMNVKPNRFWKSVKTDFIWDERLIDIIKRTVYRCVNIDKNKEWLVIKCAIKIINKIKNSPEIQNIKPNKLAISLVYIGCKCQNINLDKRDFAKDYGISIETLHNHENVIQRILQKNI